MITYFKWTDHLGWNKLTTALVGNGDGENGIIREGSKRPVLPAVKDVPRVHPNSHPFEGSGSHWGTISFLNFKEGLLFESGVNDLEIFFVNLKNSTQRHRGRFTYNGDEASEIRLEYDCFACHDDEVELNACSS